MEEIERMLLFSISNYFHKFSDAYRTVHGITDAFANDWYDYVEYGTTDSFVIMLERNGFSRETAMYIKNINPNMFLAHKTANQGSIFRCLRVKTKAPAPKPPT